MADGKEFSSLSMVPGVYEWRVPNATGSTGRLESPTFEVGGYRWCLLLFLAGNEPTKTDHVSLFLHHLDANTCPPGSNRCPDTSFCLTIKNNMKRSLDCRKGSNHVFDSEQMDWGFARIIRRDQLTANSGFLAADGSMVLHVEVEVKNPKPPTSLYRDPGSACMAAGFLSLLDEDPGATSDLTVIVGGGNGSAAGGSGSSSNSSSGGGDGSSSSLPRSFRVHRAVLAARCPFFRTLFNAGMADSAVRELPLPDADPDAFAVLLRYMYGGRVPLCERAVHRAAVQLCDTLLLPQVKEALERRLVESADGDTIAADLLWAAGHGREEVLEELVAVYKRVAEDVDSDAVEAMATTCPKLVARLLIGVTKRKQGQGQGTEGDRKRARE